MHQRLWRAQINTSYIGHNLEAVRTVYLANWTLKYNLANVPHGFRSRKLFIDLLVSAIVGLGRDGISRGIIYIEETYWVSKRATRPK